MKFAGLAAVIALSVACAASGQTSIATTVATTSTTSGSGVFINLTPSGAGLVLQSFQTYFYGADGASVTVQVWTRPGTYAGFTTSSAGWTLTQTVSGTSAGFGPIAPDIRLTDPIVIPAGQTTAVYLQGTDFDSALAYTATPPNSWSNSDLTVFSDTLRNTTVAFGGGQLPNRAFCGVLTYVFSSQNGACCRRDGSCTLGSASDCATEPAGQFQYGTSTCSGVSCQQPGACCGSTNAACTVSVAWDCNTTPQAAGTTCSPTNPCPGGACCKKDGTCTVTTSAYCPSVAGVYTMDGTTCAAAACPQPTGCCLPYGGCVVLTANDCTAAGGTAAAPNTLCASAGCWTSPTLYNNGGVVTNPGLATGGADASLIAPGEQSVSYEWSASAGASVADDFTIPPGRTWTVTTFRTMGYDQFGSASFNTYTALYVRIWNGDPRNPSSAVVWGDLTTNVLNTSTTVWSNAYRVLGIPGDTSRALWDLHGNVPSVVLNSGTYWVEYSGTDSVLSSIVPVSSFGQGVVVLPFGNALLHKNGVWAPEVDQGYAYSSWVHAGLGGAPFGLPFILEGFAGVCCQADGTCTATAVAGSPNPTCATGTYNANATCSPNSCPLPSGVCCRGATCNTTISQSSCTGSGTAGAKFSTVSGICNASGVRTTPCCYADFNKSGTITVQDIFDFLAAWFAHSPLAKVGGDGTGASPTVQSIFDFLAAWFSKGC